MKFIDLIFCIILIIPVAGLAQKSPHAETTDFVFDCRTCHICDRPTKKDPCLRTCPRAELITIHHSPEEGPGRIVMDEFEKLTDMYNPVTFRHKVHAEMSELSGGCAMCHHNNPPGNILACRHCHELDRSRTDISKPDLLASYHRQCMDCHREWNHSTSCTSCHTLKSEGSQPDVPLDLKETEGRIHPKLTEPGRLLYQTEYEDGQIVTFYHNEHVKLFGLECGDCHKRESCIRCHDKQKKRETTELSHDRCSDCHNTDDRCNFCHGNDVQPPFNHLKKTGFDTGRFHKNLICSDCHRDKLKISRPDRTCKSCHRSWNTGSFDHKRTGFILNENHNGIDCEECHTSSTFNETPGCTSCHDEEMKYPKNKPGRKIF
jgi:hypothetical protein